MQQGEIHIHADPVVTPILYDSMSWCNSDTETETLRYSEKETQLTSTTFAASTTVGATVESSVGLNIDVFSAGAKFTVNTEVSMSTTRTQTSTKERLWSNTEQVKIGPQRRVTTQCWVNQGAY